MKRPPSIKAVPAFRVFKTLTTPEKIQDFVNGIPINFEVGHDTCRSPLMVLERNGAQCVEGALLAAAALWYLGEPPQVLDLRTTLKDSSHVVALFRRRGRWGAISKTNHSVLRYRDPVYRNIHELVMSYFNEHFLDNGVKTLRSYSFPFSLLPYGDEWLTETRNLWGISQDIDDARHYPILPKGGERLLRKADTIERETGKFTEWKRKK